MVAACMSAETGVGPAMASGNQVKSGICALFPTAPIRSKIVISVITGVPEGKPAAWAKTSENVTDLKVKKSSMIPSMNPRSPIRFITKAFLAA
jgi:hypothetical protein